MIKRRALSAVGFAALFAIPLGVLMGLFVVDDDVRIQNRAEQFAMMQGAELSRDVASALFASPREPMGTILGQAIQSRSFVKAVTIVGLDRQVVSRYPADLDVSALDPSWHRTSHAIFDPASEARICTAIVYSDLDAIAVGLAGRWDLWRYFAALLTCTFVLALVVGWFAFGQVSARSSPQRSGGRRRHGSRLDSASVVTGTLRHERRQKRSQRELIEALGSEIGAPLTSILGYASLGLEETTDEAQRLHCLRAIRDNGNHLVNITNDILDFDRIDAGTMEIECTEFRPADIVEEVVSLFGQTALDHGIELRAEYPHPIPDAIVSDPNRIRQILVNLVGNAIKFTEHGGVTITTLVEDTAGIESMRFDVQDTGPGVTPAQLRAMVERFTLGRLTTSRQGAGGLGLAISHQLAKLLGGGIGATSELGAGTVFSLTVALDSSSSTQRIAFDEDGRRTHESDFAVGRPRDAGFEEDSDEPLQSSYRGNPNMEDCIEFFLERLPGRIDQLEHGLTARDIDSITEVTRILKEMGGTVGYSEISEIAERVEEALAKRCFDRIRVGVRHLIQLCRRAQIDSRVEARDS